ncbi:MAG TPA: L-fucose/L-arabinose isomerase family protein [Anaerolineaceae bacterium]|nr:L-fucose/L-arabinose isomerase family protein [Anaerolineaceae bacterium]
MAITLGVIVGNRDFFPDSLVGEGRKTVLAVLKKLGYEAVILDETASKLGAVETWADAQKCADLFRANAKKIDGILVTLPNFGDERGVADAIKLSGLNVPVLVHAFPDDLDRLAVATRRDSFCGKISVCNNLYQYGIPYNVTQSHTLDPETQEFEDELRSFAGICRLVKGMRSARLGAVGARPGAFNTVRYSEKLLQSAGVTVVTVDLSEIFSGVARLADDNTRVKEKISEIYGYARSETVPPASIVKMAKFGLVLSDWMEANSLDASALQCWNSIQKTLGVNACTLMSMMSDRLMPSACEVDVAGVAAMYALQLASGAPSALVDWNNNYAGDPNKCVFFHCGNWARSFVPDLEISNAPILGTTLGVENTYGAMSGRVPAGPMTFARIETDDRHGVIRAYAGEGCFTDDPLDTFGSRAVVEVPNLQSLMYHITTHGFAHHTAMSASHVAGILNDGFETYLGWETYWHEGKR